MKSLSDLLSQKMDQSSTWKAVNASLIVEAANQLLLELFGPEGCKLAQAMFFKNRTLTFACLSSAMAQELRLNEKKIVAHLNQKLGQNHVIKIRYLA